MRKFGSDPPDRGGRAAHGVFAGGRRVGGRSCSSAARRSSTSAAPIARVSLTSADVADAVVTSANQLLVQRQDARHHLDVRLGARRRHAPLRSRRCSATWRASTTRCKRLFPGETIEAQSNGKGDRAVRPRVEQGRRSTRRSTSPPATSRRPTTSSTCCRCRRARASNQVLLRVRFAEVSRSAMTELGRVALHRRERLQGRPGARTTTHARPRPSFDNSGSGQARSWCSATSSTCSCSTRSTSSAR